MMLAEMTWPEFREVSRDTVVLAPFAACEQHGPFLPFATDAVIASEVAARAEAVLGKEVLLLPTQGLGASQHHLPFGALTADVETHVRLVYETCDSMLQAGFRRLFVLNGHGGNIDTMHLALRQLDRRYPEVVLASASYWDVAATEIASILEGPLKRVGHACEVETSLMLWLRPDLVRRELIRDDHNFPAAALRGWRLPQRGRWGTVGAEGSRPGRPRRRGAPAAGVVARVVAVVRELRHPPGWRPRNGRAGRGGRRAGVTAALRYYSGKAFHARDGTPVARRWPRRCV